MAELSFFIINIANKTKRKISGSHQRILISF